MKHYMLSYSTTKTDGGGYMTSGFGACELSVNGTEQPTFNDIIGATKTIAERSGRECIPIALSFLYEDTIVEPKP